jgi:predicted lipoprotein with Yx(FWY)xxD motif
MPGLVSRPLLAATAAATVAVGCSSGGSLDVGEPSPTRAAPAPPLVRARAALRVGLPKYRRALRDAAGRAVYTFSPDAHGNATCLGVCARVWPPVITNGMPTIKGAEEEYVGTLPRGDGTFQATFSGWPLYYYWGDRAPGQTEGVGRTSFGGHWYLIMKSSNQVG